MVRMEDPTFLDRQGRERAWAFFELRRDQGSDYDGRGDQEREMR